MPSAPGGRVSPGATLAMTAACALVAGVLVALQLSWAIAGAAVIAFVLLWFWRPLYVLVLPALWQVLQALLPLVVMLLGVVIVARIILGKVGQW